jgi:hypothetical protein
LFGSLYSYTLTNYPAGSHFDQKLALEHGRSRSQPHDTVVQSRAIACWNDFKYLKTIRFKGSDHQLGGIDAHFVVLTLCLDITHDVSKKLIGELEKKHRPKGKTPEHDPGNAEVLSRGMNIMAAAPLNVPIKQHYLEMLINVMV